MCNDARHDSPKILLSKTIVKRLQLFDLLLSDKLQFGGPFREGRELPLEGEGRERQIEIFDFLEA